MCISDHFLMTWHVLIPRAPRVRIKLGYGKDIRNMLLKQSWCLKTYKLRGFVLIGMLIAGLL